MPYIVDMTSYDFIKNTVHFECLHKLQLYQLAGYDTYYTQPVIADDILYEKERMYSIHKKLKKNIL